MDKNNFFAEDPSNIEFGKIQQDTAIPPDQQGNTADDTTPDKPKKRNHDDRRWERLMEKSKEKDETISELMRFKDEVVAGKFSNDSNNDPIPEHFKTMFQDGLTVEERWAMQRQYDAKRESEIVEKAERAALSTITKQQQEQSEWETYIDDQLENIEEKYDVDLTSGTTKAEKLKKEFLKTLHKVSPKDDSGQVTQYASFEDTFEFWAEGKGFKTEVDNSSIERKKDIASLGNNRPAAVPNTNEAGEGGMWGWRKDLPANSN